MSQLYAILTPDSEPIRVLSLTVGSAVGSIRDIFAKIDGINTKHGKFDVVLCIGDFFGPVKTDGTTDNPEVAQLLNGDIVGTPVCLSPSRNALTKSSLCSSVGVLCHARRTPFTVPRD